MNTVYIVDDEYLVRESIKSSLDWPRLGLQIVGEGKDGRQALEQMEKLKPQIALVDINIPFINGIELSKRVRQFNPSMKIIIVTGYGEFEYARNAIEAGVISYLLKPIDSKELVEVLMKAQKEIDEEIQKKLFIDLVKRREQMVLREKFLKKLVTSKEVIHDFYKNAVEFDVELSEDNLCVAVIIIDDLKDKFKQEKDVELWKFAVSNVAEEVFMGKYHSVFFNGPEDQIVVVFNALKGEDNNSCKLLCESIRKIIKQHFKFTITLGLGRIYNGYSHLNESYNEAVNAIKSRFLYGFDRVIMFNPENSQDKKISCLSYYEKDDIIVKLRLGNIDEIKDRIQSIFSELSREKSSKEHTVFIAMNLISAVMEFLNENNYNFINILNDDLLESLLAKGTNSQLMDFVLELYMKSINTVFNEKNHGISKIVEKAKWYIEKNLTSSELSLEEIAESIFVNASYLSKIFKQEIGSTLVEYITSLRLNKSKEIMDKGSFVNIEKLAGQIGYNDQYYFYKCFKKHFGLTPKKYLENKSVK